MRRILVVLISACLILVLATGAMAEQVDVYDQSKNKVKSVVFVDGKNQYFINGQTPGVQMDAAPYIAQGRTFVPVRYLGNALGVANENITWDTGTGTAKLSLDAKSAELVVGKKQLKSSGQDISMDVAPELKAGRTYLPARFVCEALGFEVKYVDGLVVAWPKGQPEPDVSGVKNYINPPAPVQPEGTYNLNGYTVPKKPKSEILVDEDKGNHVEISLGIIVNGYVNGVLTHNRDVSKQCDEVEQILASKFGRGFAKKVVDVARTKTTQLVQLEKEFMGPNGEVISVVSGWGDVCTSITIWSKGA